MLWGAPSSLIQVTVSSVLTWSNAGVKANPLMVTRRLEDRCGADACTAILRGALPTGIFVTAPLSRSTIDTSFESSFVVRAVLPPGPLATQCGRDPTLIVFSIRFV